MIIPCFCCAATLLKAVSSVFEQSVLPREVILVDDCSDDHGKTKDAIARVVDDFSRRFPSIDLISISLEVNCGAGGARNAGIDEASGEYIAFLDADDVWLSTKLEVHLRLMDKHREYLMLSHLYDFSSSGSKPSCEELLIREVGLSKLIFKNYFFTSCVMVRNVSQIVFPTQLRYSEDYYLWLELVARGFRCGVFNSVHCVSTKNYFYESGLSSDLWLMHKGVVEGFRSLVNQRVISYPIYIIAICVEKVKYFKRLAGAFIRNRFVNIFGI